jgi:hypothetical protein
VSQVHDINTMGHHANDVEAKTLLTNVAKQVWPSLHFDQLSIDLLTCVFVMLVLMILNTNQQSLHFLRKKIQLDKLCVLLNLLLLLAL